MTGAKSGRFRVMGSVSPELVFTRMPCGCIRGNIACDEAVALVQGTQTTFSVGLATGIWSGFDEAREKLESHFIPHEAVVSRGE
jgi:hypothetical protein